MSDITIADRKSAVYNILADVLLSKDRLTVRALFEPAWLYQGRIYMLDSDSDMQELAQVSGCIPPDAPDEAEPVFFEELGVIVGRDTVGAFMGHEATGGSLRVRRDGLEGLLGDLANDMTLRVALGALASL